ncbi:hypothetical protein [Pseudanabaena galeata]|uniref:hypothetical protein n=1 Tax=Pseudanabaena galeata TaxID=1112103 RepID=UPI00247A5A7A|nr:hypothetical protein [Pseudanabaena galeata]MEA5488770.1 hypothetical protein [Pseudanabaena sp. CCNP1317]WGS71274.1 hypothetical protein OA858_16330 [Pseudanabaena galeata CCNP1313]
MIFTQKREWWREAPPFSFLVSFSSGHRQGDRFHLGGFEDCLIHLQQLPIKRTTRKNLKALQSNAFKFFWFGFKRKALYVTLKINGE